MLTIKDIAKLSGYSITTISRVLNNSGHVNKETKQQILKIIQENNFQVNLNAKKLKQKKSKSIHIIIKGNSNMLFVKIIEEIYMIDKLSKYELVSHYIDEDENEILVAKRIIRENLPLGIIFLGGFIKNFTNNFNDIEIPCLLLTVNASEILADNISSVAVDDYKASKLVINKFISKNKTNICMITGSVNKSNPSSLRYKGAYDTIIENGFTFDEKIQLEQSRYSLVGGYDACVRLLKNNKNVNAIYCASDVMALGAIRAIIDEGKRVPDDIAVIGYDGLDIALFSIPRLTTIFQDPFEISNKGINVFLNQIEESEKGSHIYLDGILLEGMSI